MEPPEIGLGLALLVGPHEAFVLVDPGEQGVVVVPAGADIDDDPVVTGGRALAGHAHVGDLQLVQQRPGQGVHGEAVASPLPIAPQGLPAPVALVGAAGVMDLPSHIFKDGLELFSGDHIWCDDPGKDVLNHFVDLLVADGGLHQGVGAALGGRVATAVRGGIGDGVLALLGQDHLAVHRELHPSVHIVLGIGLLQVGDRLIHVAAAVHHPVENGRRPVHGQGEGEGGGGLIAQGVHGADGEGLGLVAALVRRLQEGEGHCRHVLGVDQLFGGQFMAGVEGALPLREPWAGGVDQRHHSDLRFDSRPDPDGVSPRYVGQKSFRLGFGTAQVFASQRAVLCLHGHRAQGGNEGLSGHVGGIPAGVRDADRNVLDLPAVGIRGNGKGKAQRRFIGALRQKGFRRGILSRGQDQKRSRAHGRYRVLHLQDGGENAAVLEAFDLQGILSGGPHHLLCDGVQQLPLEALGQKGIYGGGGAARFHGHPVHRGLHGGGGGDFALVAAAVLQKDAHRLLPGGGEVVLLGEAHAHPVRVLKLGDELVRRGLIAGGEGHPHGHGGGGRGVLDDQQARDHPEPGDHLHHVPAQGRAALVRQAEGLGRRAERAARGDALSVFSVYHGGEAVVDPQQEYPQGQQKAQQAQEDRPSPPTGDGDSRHIPMHRAKFHGYIIALSCPPGHIMGKNSQIRNGFIDKK